MENRLTARGMNFNCTLSWKTYYRKKCANIKFSQCNTYKAHDSNVLFTKP